MSQKPLRQSLEKTDLAATLWVEGHYTVEDRRLRRICHQTLNSLCIHGTTDVCALFEPDQECTPDNIWHQLAVSSTKAAVAAETAQKFKVNYDCLSW